MNGDSSPATLAAMTMSGFETLRADLAAMRTDMAALRTVVLLKTINVIS